MLAGDRNEIALEMECKKCNGHGLFILGGTHRNPLLDWSRVFTIEFQTASNQMDIGYNVIAENLLSGQYRGSSP